MWFKKNLWFGKNATIKDYVNYFIKRKGIRIGFCSKFSTRNSFLIPYFLKYNNVTASTRFRVNNVIFYFLNFNEINARFFNPWGKYDILIFQKNFSKKAYSIALKHKKKGTKIILDVNVNYFDTEGKIITKKQNEDILRFIKITDLIITTTDYLKNYIVENNHFVYVEVIPEVLSNDLFKVQKIHQEKEEISFLYVGNSLKAAELELIKDDIEKLNKKYNLNLITICERPPKLNININNIFIKFDHSKLPKDMIKGDIFLAPRDLSEPYNLGHSFTKIGYPMAVGIPVIASPIPSYLNSPAFLCYTKNEWYNKIEPLINNFELRNEIGQNGIRYCKKYYSEDIIIKKYLQVCKKILND